jgi:hypothetical protein
MFGRWEGGKFERWPCAMGWGRTGFVKLMLPAGPRNGETICPMFFGAPGQLEALCWEQRSRLYLSHAVTTVTLLSERRQVGVSHCSSLPSHPLGR